jgi:glycosyltransferase involved in cell wall biosynthesis
VHLEDNEMAVRSSVVTAYNEAAVTAFLKAAAGVTAVIDRLLELTPKGVPGGVFWPGYDETIDRPGRLREAIRRDIRLDPDEIAVVYTGNIHETNVQEVHTLYEAIASLRARSHKVVLVKSGWNSIPASRLPHLGMGVRDVGWIKRGRVIELLRAADVLVQPGAPGPFNDYRFPSKLPDFLASGAPVVLPASNIGLHLGIDNAVILAHGDTSEVTAAILRLIEEPDAARRIGSAGRAFALERLTWARAGIEVEAVYDELEAREWERSTSQST